MTRHAATRKPCIGDRSSTPKPCPHTWASTGRHASKRARTKPTSSSETATQGKQRNRRRSHCSNAGPALSRIYAADLQTTGRFGSRSHQVSSTSHRNWSKSPEIATRSVEPAQPRRNRPTLTEIAGPWQTIGRSKCWSPPPRGAKVCIRAHGKSLTHLHYGIRVI